MRSSSGDVRRSIGELTRKIDRLTDRQVWLLFFLYGLAIGLLIQFIILPHIFPQWHAGNGLLANIGDSEEFHEVAKLQAEAIQQNGWGVWRLSPRGQSVSGILTIFYTLFIPVPAAILPLNAALHASAALVLIKLLRLVSRHNAAAFWGAIPFIIFPSSLAWVAQIHNDSYAILGSLFFLYGWLLTMDKLFAVNTWFTGKTLLFVFTGLWLINLVRDYLLEVYVVAGGLLLFFALLWTLRFSRARTMWVKVGALMLLFFTQLYVSLDNISLNSVLSVQLGASNVIQPASTSEVPRGRTDEAEITRRRSWTYSDWVPDPIERKLQDLVRLRRGAIRNYAGSNLDTDVDLSSVGQLIGYAPRALQIGLFAPFPTDWLRPDKKLFGGPLGMIAAVEMLISYVFLFFVPFAIYRWRSIFKIYPLLCFTLFFLLMYVIAMANVGTLYRLRYPHFMTLVGLGVTYAVSAFPAIRTFLKSRQRASHPATKR